MELEFTKMHGLGNDFVVIDGIESPIELSPEQRRWLADRHRGVGCDQILLIESARAVGDFACRIFNADGGEVEQCGNGIRCAARFVRNHGLIDADWITFETLGGAVETRFQAGGRVAVNMGVPRFDPATIPFAVPKQSESYALAVAGDDYDIGAVSMGNPHAVLRVADTATAPVSTLGPAIERHERFPRGANVGFLQIESPARVRLRVWERGVGETAACGTGACAAVAVGRLRGWLDTHVTVALPGGELVIAWPGADNPLWMTGTAETAFQGRVAR